MLGGCLSVLVKILNACSEAVASALKLKEIFQVGKTLGDSPLSVCLMKTTLPLATFRLIFTVPSDDPSVQTWVHSLWLYLSLIISGARDSAGERLDGHLFRCPGLRRQ